MIGLAYIPRIVLGRWGESASLDAFRVREFEACVQRINAQLPRIDRRIPRASFTIGARGLMLPIDGWGLNSRADDLRILELLEALTRIDVFELATLPIPGPYAAGLQRGFGYRFVPCAGCEDDDPWSDALALLDQGYGACKSLSAYRAAELRARHAIAARCDLSRWRGQGRDEFHVFVRHPSGMTEDPSRALGMI